MVSTKEIGHLMLYLYHRGAIIKRNTATLRDYARCSYFPGYSGLCSRSSGDFWMDTNIAMSDFMAGFFLVFGAFKLLRLNAFAEAYAMYDIIAKRSTTYAYLYPFIEIILGFAYLFRLYPTATNLVTLIVMIISSMGVAQELAQKRTIECACLGMVFKIPMTYVTLCEDLLMAGMALLSLLI